MQHDQSIWRDDQCIMQDDESKTASENFVETQTKILQLFAQILPVVQNCLKSEALTSNTTPPLLHVPFAVLIVTMSFLIFEYDVNLSKALVQLAPNPTDML